MQCPRDDTTMDRATHEGVEVEICPACGGLWLDPGELKTLLDAYEKAHHKVPPPEDEMTVGLEMAAEKQSPPTLCPVCAADNVREEYGLASRVLVDRCPEGHGVWLDKGELEAIEEFYSRQRAEARVPVLVEFLNLIGRTWD